MISAENLVNTKLRNKFLFRYKVSLQKFIEAVFVIVSLAVNIINAAFFVIMETQFAIQSQVALQPNCTERIHMDATIMRSFQTTRYVHVSYRRHNYVGHVNLDSAKPWRFMPKSKDGTAHC